MLLFIPFFLQGGLLKKVAQPALQHVDQATDAILAQSNMTIKILWGVLALMVATLLVLAAVAGAAYKVWRFFQGRDELATTQANSFRLDLEKVTSLSDHVQALVKLYATSQAIDQGHTEDHTKFVQGLLSSANETVKQLYAETQDLQRNAREQDKASMQMVDDIKNALALFSKLLNALQDSLVTSMAMRESNHTEICALLNLILALLQNKFPPHDTAAGITAGVTAMYNLRASAPAPHAPTPPSS